MWILDTAAKPKRRLALLTIGVALNLSVLAYYKYLFVILAFFHSRGWAETEIGYLVDCQQDMVKERRNLSRQYGKDCARAHALRIWADRDSLVG
jgi:hypothetical protein